MHTYLHITTYISHVILYCPIVWPLKPLVFMDLRRAEKCEVQPSCKKRRGNLGFLWEGQKKNGVLLNNM